MSDEQMVIRLSLIAEIRTPTGRYANRIVRLGSHSVTVVSEHTGNERTIPFRDIRRRTMRHGCIIDSFRQILGLAA